MGISVYVDGSGGTNSGYGYFVKETGESFYEKKPDSKNTVNQLNHEFAINNEELRNLAREAWEIIGKFSNLSIVWVPRKENLAGKMLGS
jgi:ribonuclease HI